MNNIVLSGLILLMSANVIAGEWTAEFTGVITGIGTCRNDATYGYQILRIRNSTGNEITTYALISHTNSPYLAAEYGARYSTLLTAYQTGSEVTILISPGTNNVCGVAVNHVLWGVKVGNF